MNPKLQWSCIMSKSLTSQPYLFSEVDKIVRQVLFGRINFNEVINRLNRFYCPFMNAFESDLLYSRSIYAFISSTSVAVGDSYPSEVIWDHDKAQRFADTLSCYKKEIVIEDSAWRYQEGVNSRSLSIYIKSLTNHHGRLLFVRVDLKYAKEACHLITLDDFHDHMTKLRNYISNGDTCFKHLQGYAWALEQGYKNGGLHCHLLLMYDGSCKDSDWYLAEKVGKKWLAITEGLGYAHNCSNTKSKKRHQLNGTLGIGMIHRNNPQQVANAIITGLYLTKPSKKGQHLKVILPSMRTFGHGEYRNTKRRGLPPIAK